MEEVEIFQGSILDVKDLDAVVVPANKQLTLDWGSHLAELVKKEAGASVEEEALTAGQDAYPEGCPLGGAVMTSGGKLDVPHLIHAAVLDKYDMNPLFLLKLKHRTSVETLTAATLNSLECARKGDLKSIAFTPMGAGIGGMKTRLCIDTMLKAYDEFKNSNAAMERLVIACLKEKDVKIARECLAAYL